MITKLELKTRGVEVGLNSPARPHSRNPIYQQSVRVKCFCSNRKIFKNLWSLYNHHTYNHPLENSQYIIEYARQLVRLEKC